MDTYQEILSSLMQDVTNKLSKKIEKSNDIDEHELLNDVESISDNYYKILNSKKESLLNHCKQENDFYNNYLYDNWGEAFDYLESIINIVTEVVDLYSDTYCNLAEEENNVLFAALRTIHARTILISKECLVLLKNGFPNGAFSLWRSIYELSIIADFLYNKHDSDLCQRYIDYYHIQTYKEEQQNRKNGYPNYSEDGFKAVKDNYNLLIEKYGKEYKKGSYGWANKYFDKTAFFNDIEKESNMKKLKGYYVASSSFIHGNQKANYDSMGLIPNSYSCLVIGPSDYGLSIPMQNVAISLVNTTALFIGTYSGEASAVVISLLKKLLDELMKTATFIQKTIEEKNMENITKASD